MSTNTGIEWTEATWNPIAGCTPVSPGCLHCYAATMAYRLEKMGQEKYAGLTVKRNGVRTFNGKINIDEAALTVPLRRKKPTTYFVNSMSDLFHESVPFEFVDKVFAVMALCPQHTFQVLTKRPERMAEYMATASPGDGSRRASVLNAAVHDLGDRGGIPNPEWPATSPMDWPLPHVWLGCSVEDQKAADERIPHLLQCPAAIRFLSCEPLLGPLSLDPQGISWVIVGGESGSGARPCDIQWVRDIVRQCKEAGVPVFVKQLGSRPVRDGRRIGPWGDDGSIRCWRCGYGDFGPCADGTLACNRCDSPWDRLRDPKGGDMSEWPEDLRVREVPSSGGV